MNTKEQVTAMDNMVAQGAIVDATKKYFADNATTSDHDGVSTTGKDQMISKMEGFAGAIEKVNGITLHGCIVEGDRSASEFTFDFDMKDGSKILWHEIIQREWNAEGRVIREEYFKA